MDGTETDRTMNLVSELDRQQVCDKGDGRGNGSIMISCDTK
ncbi:hypothetical protein [Tumebacillus lipolyticus]|uniref:Uncharacterized protein n=1 Tax=Tumebacillus lipolyticus TaxID=1280370 RepID=A0ABW4ZXS9_9BACL